MSKLILKGNTNKNFGEYLPILNIEQVKILDSEIVAQVALYLTIDDGEDEETLQERLNELSYYVLFLGYESYHTDLLAQEHNIFTYLAGTDFEVEGDIEDLGDFFAYLLDSIGEYQQIAFGDFTASDDYIYDDAGNKILKMITEVSLSETLEDMSTLSEAFGGEEISWNDIDHAAVYAFSSTLDYADEEIDITEEDDNIVLLNQNVSDVSYEVIFENGELAGQAEIIWVDAEGNPFDGIPLQEIMSQYYTPDGITHQEITESFNDLLTEYNTKAQTDGVLESVVDSTSYILEIYGDKPDLVPRLNVLRKAWPQTLPTTPTGELYLRFKRKLFNANNAIRRGILLHKELVLNPKIIDLREPAATEEYVPPSQDRDTSWPYDGTFLYSHYNMDSIALRSTDAEELAYVAEYGDSPGIYQSDYLMNAGFFYFDYEKLMHSASNLAAVLDVSKIESFFGNDITNDKLKVTYLTFHRTSLEAGIQAGMYSDLTDNPAMYNTMLASYTNGTINASLNLMDGTTEESYIVMRNFAFPDGTEDSYRLMCFEFQDIMPLEYDIDDQVYFLEKGSGPTDWQYEVELKVEDKTLSVVKALTSSYSDYLHLDSGVMKEYYNVASEPCNYNNTDGVFNKFFVDNVTTAWADNMDEAPWVKGPVMYNMHRDILFDTFSGSLADIIDASKKLSDRIGPYAGTLEHLEAFVEQADAFYMSYYYYSWSLDNIAAYIKTWEDSENIYTDYTTTFNVANSNPFPPIYNETLASALLDVEIETEAALAAAPSYEYWYACFPDNYDNEEECWEEYAERLNPDVGYSVEGATNLNSRLMIYAEYFWDDCYEYYNAIFNKNEEVIDASKTFFEGMMDRVFYSGNGSGVTYGWATSGGNGLADHIEYRAGEAAEGEVPSVTNFFKFAQWAYPNYENSLNNVNNREPEYIVEGVDSDGYPTSTVYKPSAAKSFSNAITDIYNYVWRAD